MPKFVYADNAATTRLSEAVLETMLPYLRESYGNPSSIYSLARESKKAIEHARDQVAAALHAGRDEIFFNSCGTEGDNTAIKGFAHANRKKGTHIISSKIEHHAMLHTLDSLAKEGFAVTLLDVDKHGLVDPASLEAAMQPDTILVSVMTANNEIGTVEPIAELAAVAHAHGAAFHTDAVQAVGHIPIDVQALGIDLLTLSAHKFNGPKGVGALYVRKGVRVDPYLHGGAQERNRRAGTENVAGIVGLGTAITLAVGQMESETARLNALRDRMIRGVTESIPYVITTGHPTLRLPGLASFCIEFIEGESLVLSLDLAGIAASSGSACSSGSLDPSHVLMAIGLTHEIAHGSLRLSLGADTTDGDVDYILEALPAVVTRLRAMSPLWEDHLNGKA